MLFSTKIQNTIFFLKLGDIVHESTDAIVNAANQNLSGGGGVDGAIHRACGPKLKEECALIRKKYGKCLTGNAVITSAPNLKAKFIIHTVGPIWQNGTSNEEDLLKNCYLNSLKLARTHSIRTISFPSISTGAYGYPVDKAADIAIKTIIEDIKKDTHFLEVGFVLFDENTFSTYKKSLENIIRSDKV